MATQTVSDGDSYSVGTSQPFHIVTSEGDGDATTWVGLCVNPGLIDYIEQNRIVKPYMLLIAVLDGAEVSRKLVPLDKGLTYLTFSKAGTYSLHATVVWEDPDSHRAVRSTTFYQSGGMYNLNVLNYDGDGVDWNLRWGELIDNKNYATNLLQRHDHESSATVRVTDGHFAEPRAQWRQTHVSWFHEGKARDECQFRQWSISAWLRTFVQLPLHYLLKLIILAVTLIIGMWYGLDFGAVVRPLKKGPVSAMVSEINPRLNFWVHTSEKYPSGGYAGRARPWWHFALGSTVIYGAGSLIFGAGPVFSVAWKAAARIAFVVAVVLLAFGLAELRTWLKDGRKTSESYTKRVEDRKQDQLSRLTTGLGSMSCEVQGEPMDISRLLRRKRRNPTVLYYRAKDEFAKCKPFQS